MISLQTARQLKEAGLTWRPALLDYFAIPDRGLDERIFVISELLATLENIHDQSVIAFQGASEWALDDLPTEEMVWLPREDQLRQALETTLLLTTGRPEIRVICGVDGYQCTIWRAGQPMTYKSRDLSEAYAAALLDVLRDKLTTDR